jgi:signal transduction histidine kinase
MNLKKRNINIDIQLLEKSIICPINPIGIHRIIDNLLQNTLKYNKENFSLSVHLTEKEDAYSLMIADDGIGIPEDYHVNIFEPMVRVETSRNRDLGGTGLGLAIVKQIIQKHGWSIELANKTNSYFSKGCTFIIRIPK